jgi:hypothetical protein
VKGERFRVWGFSILVIGSRVYGLVCRCKGLGFRV